MPRLSRLVVRQPKLLHRLEARALRRVLSGRSLEALSARAVLAKAVRFPIPDDFFELEFPAGGAAWFDAQSAPFLYWSGFHTFEPSVVPAFAELAARATHFVDVGAAFGFYSLFAHALNPALEVTAIEPNPRHVAVLERTFRRNNADVAIVRAALADSLGTGEISLAGGHSSISPERWDPGLERVEVPLMTFDSLFSQPPDLIKIDVEGAEVRVLNGMHRTLTDGCPTIFCEIAPQNLPPVVRLLDGYGYDVLELPSRERVQPERAPSDDNFIIVRR